MITTYAGPFLGHPTGRPDLTQTEFEELREIKQRGAVGRCTQDDLVRWCLLEPFRVDGMGPMDGRLPSLHLRFQPTPTSVDEFALGCFCPARWAVEEWALAQRQADWLSCLYRSRLQKRTT